MQRQFDAGSASRAQAEPAGEQAAARVAVDAAAWKFAVKQRAGGCRSSPRRIIGWNVEAVIAEAGVVDEVEDGDVGLAERFRQRQAGFGSAMEASVTGRSCRRH